MALLSLEALVAGLERAAARDGSAYAAEQAVESDGDREAYCTRAVALLGSPSWPARNLGVKVLGLLQAACEVPRLVAILRDRTPAPWYQRLAGGDFREVGFVRRNAVTALVRMGQVTDEVEEALLAALADPYFEVRAEAARAVSVLGARFSEAGRCRAAEALARAVRDRWLEVAVASATALGAVGCAAVALPALRDLAGHRYWMVRSAALEGLLLLVRRGQVEDLPALEAAVRGFVLAATDFRPEFPIKTAYAELLLAIREMKGRVVA
jgi:UDP-N-acetylglucosamine--N-acetylmuramyl-(pentapeptide) pyrophosphoryl-undecaprenol N-acetylglucosamine transferase